MKIARDCALQRGCKVGLGIAAGKSGRLCVLAIDSINAPAKTAAAPLQARSTFVRSAAQMPRQPLAKSRQERVGRQMVMRQPLAFDVLLLRLLSPHIDNQAPPSDFCVNLRSVCGCRVSRLFWCDAAQVRHGCKPVSPAVGEQLYAAVGVDRHVQRGRCRLL